MVLLGVDMVDKIKLDLTIRLGTVDDTSFIIKTWAKTQQQIYPNNHAFDFFQKYNEYIKLLIDKSVILVSCLSDSPNDIVGFIVYTSFDHKCVVHFAYVRPDVRRDGICNNLLNTANPINAPIIFTSPAKNEHMMKHLTTKYIFDPSLIGLL